jgi:predicted TIM-barrel fold metal-dependent hydrolase
MPNTVIKLSMHGVTDPTWENGQFVIECSQRLARIFTPERTMFGTNFPVDAMPQCGKWNATKMFTVFR